MKLHYQALDGLRGTAAFSVLLFHLLEIIAPDPAHNVMRHTFLAVDFFFALSGFVVGHAYDARRSAPSGTAEALGIWDFFKRRLIRLHPMVIAAMVIGVAGYLCDPFVGDGHRIGEKLSLATLAGSVLLGLLLLPYPQLPGTFGETHSLDGPAWSLLQEYIANILYGFWGHRLRRGLHITLCLISAGALIWTAVHFGDLGRGWGWSDFWVAPVRLAYPFLTGLLIYRLKLRLTIPQPFLILSGVLIAVFALPLMGQFNGLCEAACIIFVLPAVLLAGAGTTEVRGWIGRVCRFMGEMSYPLYIIHYPFIYIFAHWKWQTNPDAFHVGLVAAGLYLGVTALAYVMLRWYDRPVRAWLTRACLRPARVKASAQMAE